MKKVIPILKKYNITYCALGGTLLGSVRSKGIIPWDDDIDIGMKVSEYKILLNNTSLHKDLDKQGLTLKKQSFFKRGWFIKIMTKEKKKYNVFIDVFPFKERKNTLILNNWMARIHCHRMDLYKENLFPVKDHEFSGMKISIPQNPYPHLEYHFGKDWKIPKNTHNHRSEVL